MALPLWCEMHTNSCSWQMAYFIAIVTNAATVIYVQEMFKVPLLVTSMCCLIFVLCRSFCTHKHKQRFVLCRIEHFHFPVFFGLRVAQNWMTMARTVYGNRRKKRRHTSSHWTSMSLKPAQFLFSFEFFCLGLVYSSAEAINAGRHTAKNINQIWWAKKQALNEAICLKKRQYHRCRNSSVQRRRSRNVQHIKFHWISGKQQEN